MSTSIVSIEIYGTTLGRWLNIILRTLHLIGIFGLGSAIYFTTDISDWSTYQQLTVVTGIGLLIIEMWRSKYFICEFRGLAISSKLILIALMHPYPEYTEQFFWLVIILAGIFSHVPGKIRHYSIFHGRRMDEK